MFALDGPGHALVIGDVCGKGPEAAAITGMLRHNIRANAWQGHEPAAVLQNLNRALLRSWPDTLCTVIYATVQPGDGGLTVSLASAGHPLPLLADGPGPAAPVGATGLVLGLFEELECPVTTLTLAPGATLVLYTDGACDLPPPHDLDEAELCALVGEALAGTADADAAVQSISDRLAARTTFAARPDDVALVAVRATASRPGG